MSVRVLFSILTALYILEGCNNNRAVDDIKIGGELCIIDSDYVKRKLSDRENMIFVDRLLIDSTGHYRHALVASRDTALFVSVIDIPEKRLHDQLADRYDRIYERKINGEVIEMFGNQERVYLYSSLIYEPSFSHYILIDVPLLDSAEARKAFDKRFIHNIIDKCEE